nr:uncharacterized protein LOC111838940 isoform X2 [Paramormyrops kingsleyae]
MMVCLLLLLCLGHCLPAVLGVYLSIDCHAGGTVMLPCYGEAATDTKEVDVLWKLNGWPACWFKNGEWCENSHLVNRAQLGSIRQNNFSLIINTVRNEDEGVYTCEISEDKKQTIHLVVKGDWKREDAETPPGDPACRPYREREDPPGASSGGNSVVTGVIVGIVITVAMVGAALFTR